MTGKQRIIDNRGGAGRDSRFQTRLATDFKAFVAEVCTNLGIYNYELSDTGAHLCGYPGLSGGAPEQTDIFGIKVECIPGKSLIVCY